MWAQGFPKINVSSGLCVGASEATRLVLGGCGSGASTPSGTPSSLPHPAPGARRPELAGAGGSGVPRESPAPRASASCAVPHSGVAWMAAGRDTGPCGGRGPGGGWGDIERPAPGSSRLRTLQYCSNLGR